jgi:VIT1/CCC1 family predicted Fe2+/Mn2+ transporter
MAGILAEIAEIAYTAITGVTMGEAENEPPLRKMLLQALWGVCLLPVGVSCSSGIGCSGGY